MEKKIEIMGSTPFLIFDYGLPNKKVYANKVACGFDFSALVDMQGHVHTWGLNMNGQLGVGDQNVRLHPT